MPEGPAVGSTGGIIGLLAGIGAPVIPAWDQFIAAGPIIIRAKRPGRRCTRRRPDRIGYT